MPYKDPEKQHEAEKRYRLKAKNRKENCTPEEWEARLAKARAMRQTPAAKAKRKAWRQANRDKLREAANKWAAANPEKVKDKHKRYKNSEKGVRMSAEYWQRFVKEHPEYMKQRQTNRVITPAQKRKWMLKANYGMTPETYEAIVQCQGGVCAICNKPPTAGKLLAVDHNHNTGRYRGLLCIQCNSALASIEADPDWGSKALNYLTKFIEQTVLDRS